MTIRQGDLFWLDLGEPNGSGPGFRHPYVIVQSDLFNASRIRTVVVCELTSNLKRAEAPGNVLLRKGEGGLKRASVVNVSQIYSVDQSALAEKIGSLSPSRVSEIFDGLRLLFEPRDV
ncbi:MAG: type II toxin-antitoxin system PemK/MazF family toxin [Candidatus Aminicenantes bacterium]|nr:type II toxin-antitoxin system PemK/MazF family toxin [Candidatus Aminicenantes bacterium]